MKTKNVTVLSLLTVFIITVSCAISKFISLPVCAEQAQRTIAKTNEKTIYLEKNRKFVQIVFYNNVTYSVVTRTMREDETAETYKIELYDFSLFENNADKQHTVMPIIIESK